MNIDRSTWTEKSHLLFEGVRFYHSFYHSCHSFYQSCRGGRQKRKETLKKLKTSLSIYFWKSNGGNAKEREMSQTARVEVENIAADCKIKLAKGNQKQFKIKLIWLKNNKKRVLYSCFSPRSQFENS